MKIKDVRSRCAMFDEDEHEDDEHLRVEDKEHLASSKSIMRTIVAL